MPNNITNRLVINASREKVNEIKNFLKGENGAIDFNNIVPQPQELNIESGSEGSLGYRYLVLIEGYKDIYHDTYDAYKDKRVFFEAWEKRSKESQLKNIEIGKQYYCNIMKYGVPTWYEWRLRNWGTKWNAYSIEETSKNAIVFDTAWSCVLDLIVMLSERFPEVEFGYEYADEDSGFNVDGGYILNGEAFMQGIENQSDDAYELYVDLKGYKEEFIKDPDTGRWHWIDDEEEEDE